MSGQGDRMLAALEHRIIEEAKRRWDHGAAGRTFGELLREVAVEQHDVKNGNVAIQITSGPGSEWGILVDHAEPDDRAP